MTYVFPPSLYPLRDFMRSLGADTMAFVTDRQAAFMAQQLLGTRVKFPPKGQDMTPALFLIQKGVTEAGARKSAQASKDAKSKAISAAADQILRDAQIPKKGKLVRPSKPRPDFSPAVFAEGVHIFCDGAAVPNPGDGGWGVVVYRDGEEIRALSGGEQDSTNNQMELTAILNAIDAAKQVAGPVTIWSDSQYCVNGINDWRHGWKAKGWQRGGDNAKPENRILLNADLWRAIDEALEGVETVSVKWVKGHDCIAGNERADELAEAGRRQAREVGALGDPLMSEYRAIMTG